jgi:hypothetical protein
VPVLSPLIPALPDSFSLSLSRSLTSLSFFINHPATPSSHDATTTPVPLPLFDLPGSASSLMLLLTL